MDCVIKKLWNSGNLIWFLFATLLISACANNQDSVVPGNPEAKTGQIHLVITDDPLLLQNVSQVNVTIDKIELQVMDSSKMNEQENTEINKETTDESGEDNSMEMEKHSGMGNDAGGNNFISVLSTPQDINLMDLRNGVTLDLADASIPAGIYKMVRLYISKASIVMNSGASFDLKIPSAAESGLKIFIPSGIVVDANNTAELLLDFNLDRSLVALGPHDNPRGFHLRPVIRAVDNSYCGKLEGHVTDTSKMALSDAYLWVKGDTVISSTTSLSSGFYRMIGLPEGNYTLFAAKEGYDTAKIEDLHVWGRRETKEDIEMTPSSD